MKLMKAVLLCVSFVSSVANGTDIKISVLTPVYQPPAQISIPYEGLGNVSIKPNSPEQKELGASLYKVTCPTDNMYPWDHEVKLTAIQAIQDKKVTDKRMLRLEEFVPEEAFKENNYYVHRLIFGPDGDKATTLFLYYTKCRVNFERAAIVAARMVTLQKVVSPEFCRIGNPSIQLILNKHEQGAPSSTDDFIQLFSDLAGLNIYKEKLSFENLTRVAFLIWKVVGDQYLKKEPDIQYLELNPIVKKVLVHPKYKADFIVPIIYELMQKNTLEGLKYDPILESSIVDTIKACDFPDDFFDATLCEFTSLLYGKCTNSKEAGFKEDQIPVKLKNSFKNLSGRDDAFFTLGDANKFYFTKERLLTLFSNAIPPLVEENALSKKIQDENVKVKDAFLTIERYYKLLAKLGLEKKNITWEMVEAAQKKEIENYQKLTEEHKNYMKAFKELESFIKQPPSPVTDASKTEPKT